VPDLGVLLHLRALVGAQRPRLEENRVRDGELAEVVQSACDTHRVGVEPERRGEQRAVLAHPLDVRPGLGFAVLDRLGQPQYRLLLRHAEARQRVVGDRRALEDPVLQLGPVRPRFDLRVPSMQRVVDGDHDVVALERLDDVAVGADVERDLRHLGVIGPAHHDHDEVRTATRELAGEAQSRLAWDVHGKQHDDGLDLRDPRSRLVGRARRGAGKPGGAQHG